MCAKAKELQENYIPSDGDYVIAKASYDSDFNVNCSDDNPCDECIVDDNIFVIDNHYDYAKSIGGTYWFFDGTLCSKDGGNIANDTCCSVITKTGKKNNLGLYSIYPLKDFLWIPKLNQLIKLLTVSKFYDYFVQSKGCIDESQNDLEINILMYLMKDKYNKYWNYEEKQWRENN